MSKPGYVYALINPSMPGLVKVGRTERDPSVRVSELSGVTGVATPFILIFHQAFEDCVLAEEHVHAVLEKHGRRFSANREFFQTQPTTAIHAILKAPGAAERILDANISSIAEGSSQNSIVDELITQAKAYLWGNGEFPKDPKEAVRIYLKAGKLGSGQAYYELSAIYDYGGPFMPSSWLATNSKSNEAKKQEYMRRSCELNYAPAWAKLAYGLSEDRNVDAERRAWQKFFHIAHSEIPQIPTENEESGYWTYIFDARKFLTPRPQLSLGYFPCSAKIGGEHFGDALAFMRSHSNSMLEAVENHIDYERKTNYPSDPFSPTDFGADREACRKHVVNSWLEVLRWVGEL